MAIQIIFVLAETYGLRIYAIMLPSSDLLDAYFVNIGIRPQFRLLEIKYP